MLKNKTFVVFKGHRLKNGGPLNTTWFLSLKKNKTEKYTNAFLIPSKKSAS